MKIRKWFKREMRLVITHPDGPPAFIAILCCVLVLALQLLDLLPNGR